MALPQGIEVAREKGIGQALFIDLQRLPGHYENSCGGSRLEKESQEKVPVAWQLRIVVKKGKTSVRRLKLLGN
jgi:hypothetical protein